MKRLIKFSVLIVLIILNSQSFAGEITGRVTDSETKNVIRDVNVKILGTDLVTATDKHGQFRINKLEDGEYQLVFTHVAYDKSEPVKIELNGEASINVALNPAPWVLNDVVVTGTRSPHLLKDVPVQTEVVSQRDFERTGANTVDEALTSSIGLSIREDLSGQSAQIRGVEGDRVLVLIDGERAVGRVNGSIDLAQYSLNNVEKIEIVKGTGSTLYGSDAMGGVINIITEKPKETAFSGNTKMEYGSFKQANPSIDLKYGNEKTAFVLGGKFYRTDGFDLNKETPHTNGQEEISRFNLSGKLRHELSDKWSSTLSGRFMTENRDWIESEIIYLKGTIIDSVFVPTDSAIVPFDDEEINKRYEGSLNFDYLSGDKYSMKFRLFGTFYDHNWNKYNRVNGAWEDTSDTEDLFLEASYTSNYVIGANHVATYGFDYNYQDLKSTELVTEKEADKSFAGYFQYEYQPAKTVNMVLGSRYEHHSSFGDHFNPSLNVMYKPSEQFKLRGFVGKGFRAPSIKQQYFVFDHTSAGYIVYGGLAIDPEAFEGQNFSDLKQETSINSSISAEFSYGTMGLHRLTYFYNHLDDLIDFQLVDFGAGYWRGRYVYQNIETAITQGIEWESRIRLTNNLDFRFSYNYLFSENLETQEQLVNRPEHTFKFFFTGMLDAYKLGASFYGDYHSKKLWVPRTNTGGNEGGAEYAPQRTTLNFNIFKRFKNSEILFRMENIFDKTNVTYGYWPGREIFVGFKYDFIL